MEHDVAINVGYVNPFINATINVLSTMGGVNPVPGKPHLKEGVEAYGDVSGIIGLAGEGVRGFFAVSFLEPCIFGIMSGMFGETYDTVGSEVKDAVGEITNMISGGAKAELSNKGYFFDVAIPTIVSGKGHHIRQVAGIPVIVVPFETEAGSFYIEASLYTGPLPEEELGEIPEGMIGVTEFSQRTGVRTATVRRWLSTGFLKGKKINNKVWHIPEEEVGKVFSGR